MRTPVSFAPRVMLEIVDLVTCLEVFSHDQIHIKAHTMSQQTLFACPAKPGSSSRDGQPICVDAPDQVVIPGDVEMPGEEFDI